MCSSLHKGTHSTWDASVGSRVRDDSTKAFSSTYHSFSRIARSPTVRIFSLIISAADVPSVTGDNVVATEPAGHRPTAVNPRYRCLTQSAVTSIAVGLDTADRLWSSCSVSIIEGRPHCPSDTAALDQERMYYSTCTRPCTRAKPAPSTDGSVDNNTPPPSPPPNGRHTRATVLVNTAVRPHQRA